MSAITKQAGMLVAASLFLLLRLPVTSPASLENMSTSYKWTAGSWSSCHSSELCGEGHRERTVWCKHDVFVVDEDNCKDSERPATVEACFRVCEELKERLRWSVGPWSACTPLLPSPPDAPCTDTVPGNSSRQVTCLFRKDPELQIAVDSSSCEYFWDKPASQMPCSTDCPQHCLVARRAVSCTGCEGKLGTQEVTEVVVAPANGGQECSNPESSACSATFDPSCELHAHETYKKLFLKVGQWEPCRPEKDGGDDDVRKPSVEPLIGTSRREISCVTADGHVANTSNCAQFQSPPDERRCVLPRDCELSPLSEWRVLTEGCVASDGEAFPEVRIRTRVLVRPPLGQGRPCPPLYERRNVAQGLPNCNKYKWAPLSWSECEVRSHGYHGEVHVARPTCGSGLQYRNSTCLRTHDMAPVSDRLCKDPVPEPVRRCTLSCRRDCTASGWSRWGPCRAFNNTDYTKEIKSGYRTRSRGVLVSPSPDGRPCPPLHEAEACEEIEIFQWKYGVWSECAPERTGAPCGPGKRTRNATCVNYDGFQMRVFFCKNHVAQGELSMDCRVPCPDDCLHSDWSAWTPCVEACYSQTAAVAEKSRNRTLLAVQGEGGAACKRRRHQADDCDPQPCRPHSWRAGQWGPCLRAETLDATPEAPCGLGTQRRNVTCGAENGEFDAELCEYIPKPDTRRRCGLPCPVDCVVTNFSDWTHCDDNCGRATVQSRRRLVLQGSQSGGRPCPEGLVEKRPCDQLVCLQKNEDVSPYFRWRTGSWSDCEPVYSNQPCGVGVGWQVRTVSCIDKNDREMEPHYCMNSSPAPTSAHNVTSGVPSAQRTCEITCVPRCTLSAWSAWSDCGFGYQPKRTRTRESWPANSEPDCSSRDRLVESELCPAILPAALDNNHWMSCIVQNQTEAGVDRWSVSSGCGEGYRSKLSQVIDEQLKVKLGVQHDLCLVDCPVDCQMSSWTSWSACDVPCGHGFEERMRQIDVPANALGRPCPKTVNKTEIERKVCSVQCSNFYWFSFGWNECQLSDDAEDQTCGDGKQFRTVACLDRRTESEVDTTHCDPLQKPRVESDCRIYCAGECVVGPWAIWKECSEPCSETNYEEVRRRIVRKPGPKSTPCPSLISVAPCVANVNCYSHSWALGPWGTCLLPEGALCGEGVVERPLLCRRSDGRQVDAIQCEKNHKPLSLQDPISKPCYVDCPIDCMLSEWSEWNETDCSLCGAPRAMSRKRRVLQHPSEGGRPCTEEMMQFKPCSFKPCYHWKHTEWSNCDLQGAHCGYGLRRREVSCVRYDDFQVDQVYCFTVNISFPLGHWVDAGWFASAQPDSLEEEICHKSCPGECIMSEWSYWSPCHKNCLMGQTVGYQTSSRMVLALRSGDAAEPCEPLEYKTKPCWDDDCDYFQWRIRNGSLVCEGEDGLVVEDGCTSAPKPCEESCESSGGRCDFSTGRCDCGDGPAGHHRTGPGTTGPPCGMVPGMEFNGPHPPSNHSAPTSEVRLKYYPDDSQVSIWMYAMISIGSAFVIFVAVTVYLMCRSSVRQRSVNVERQASLRRREHAMTSTPDHVNHSSSSSPRLQSA